MIRYIVGLYMLACTIIMTSMLITSVAYATHGEEHGPGWHSSNCDSLPWVEGQAEFCNMMGLENKILEHNGYKIWEFDDSYIIMYEDKEVLRWDCILDNDTTPGNKFFCAVMMDYDYETIHASFK